ncbi:uncharacterized protein LOC108735723 [Agrilus planipennis]|uniref:Uncharacterized protein LOC108735723 n=1 Tax=Agrilus planipennis TaxID=224129 RepID=A0A1W4WTH7_AGRPL|nr:uncharacterized protein LOC108735723 [Agrilus planipennis]
MMKGACSITIFVLVHAVYCQFASFNLVSQNPSAISSNEGTFLPLSPPHYSGNVAAKSPPSPHFKVLEVASYENQLHPSLLNPFYKNPEIANQLAGESLRLNNEFPVYNRDSEHISRSEIAKIIHHSGLGQ